MYGLYTIFIEFSCLHRLAPILNQLFINVSYHILVASLTLMVLPSELYWLQVHDMAH